MGIILFDSEFDSIILPATSICIFDYKEIENIFEMAYKALKPGKIFLFDIRLVEEEMDNFKAAPNVSALYKYNNISTLIMIKEFYNKTKDAVYVKSKLKKHYLYLKSLLNNITKR